MDSVGIGVIGAGRIGGIHARNLKHYFPDVALLAISDLLEEVVNPLAQELQIPHVYKGYEEILENKNIHGIVISSPTNTHARIIIEAASVGKDIFCEKPIALEMEEIYRALKAVEEGGVKLQVGFNRRFDPSFRKAQEIVASGEIGEPHLLRITSRDPEPPSLSYLEGCGGLFLDMMIHDFDMARFLLGDEVSHIFAVGDCLCSDAHKANDIDTAIVTLTFKKGTLGSIDNSRQAIYGYDNRVEVFGPGGCVMVGNRRNTEVMVKGAHGLIQDKPLYFFVERYQEAYLAEMKEFIGMIKEDKEPSVTGHDGMMAVLLGFAANESMATGSIVAVNQ